MSKNEMKVNENEDEHMQYFTASTMKDLEGRIIALERGLEALLRRLEASTSPDDEAGWYGRPE